MISSFLALGTDVEYTFPSSFKDIINKIVKEYMLDIENFRIKNKQKILDEIYKMKDIRTKVTTSLMKKEKWDFFMTVFIGLKSYGISIPDYVQGKLFRSKETQFVLFDFRINITPYCRVIKRS